jgi:uncharacterized protein
MSLQIENDEKERRFYAVVDGHEAHVGYAKSGNVYNLLHTYVPEELRGHKVGDQLVQGTLDEIKAKGGKFIPTCPFVQAFLKKHPEYQEGVAHHA